MTLDELQKKITPLPWKRDGRYLLENRQVMGKPMSLLGLDVEGAAIVFCVEDAIYLHHCANHFQQVVEAAMEYQKAVQDAEDNRPDDEQGTTKQWQAFSRLEGRALAKAQAKLDAILKSAQEVSL